MLVPIQKIFKAAQQGKFAVGAFNTSNLETTLAIIRAAVKLKSPVIIQTSESAISYSNLKSIYNLIKTAAETEGKTVPISIHLDHGKTLSVVKNCIKIGYNSVHIDASEKDWNTNVKWTKEIVKLARRKGIGVQAELGAILGKEGLVKLKKGEIKMEDLLTIPAQAKKFASLTKIDSLAVAVGTIHGSFKGVEKVDQPRLQKIHKLVKIPLVLHGGSGLSPAVYKQAIKNGIRVVNIDTNLRLAWKKALTKSLKQQKDLIDPRKILSPGTDAIQAEVERMIKILGSNGQAKRV